MSVNISPRQLMQPGIVDAVGQMMRKHSLAHGTLALEITESALAEDAATAMRVIKELKMLPVQLLLDDFGTGYSSLGHLHRLPRGHREDRSLVPARRIHSIRAARTSSPRSCRSPRISEKASSSEGIETAEQVERLRKLRCPHAQGFYFEAVDAVEASALIALASATAGRRSPFLGAGGEDAAVAPASISGCSIV